MCPRDGADGALQDHLAGITRRASTSPPQLGGTEAAIFSGMLRVPGLTASNRPVTMAGVRGNLARGPLGDARPAQQARSTAGQRARRRRPASGRELDEHPHLYR